MIKKYVKKPIPVEACQWTGYNRTELKEFTNDHVQFVSHWEPAFHWEPIGFPSTMVEEHVDLYILTLEGKLHANLGDYVIKGIHGEFYACDQQIFKESYEEYIE